MNFPEAVITDPKEKLVVVTPEVEQAFPGVEQAFAYVDKCHEQLGFTLDYLRDSVFSFRSSAGAKIDCSLLPGNGDRMLVMWAPFSDSAPKSSAEDLLDYIKDESHSGKSRAAPNSWNQLTKSAVVWELLHASGYDIPVLTIFQPLPSVPKNAYTHTDYKQIRRGDFSPAARIAEEAIARSQDRLHGPKSETQLDEFDFHGASLGASHAIGAAASGRRAVRSVTAQELIIAPKNLLDLAARFTVKGLVGEPSELEVGDDLPRIEEPLLRQMIDANGNEPIMFARMLQGMSKVSRLKGLTRPERNQTPRLIEELIADNVSVMIPLAENSGLTHGTPQYLPNAGEHVVTVRATKGERTAHLIDEHVGLTALLAVMNIKNS